MKHFGTINNPSNPAPITGPSGSLCGYLTSTSSPSIAGIFYWTWDSSPPGGLSNFNVGVAFSGLVDPSSAISNSGGVYGNLPGAKWISLGGGNSAGSWTSSLLSSVTSSINNNAFSGYQGIVFDVEQGDSGLASAFETAFAAAKAHGFKVLVTVSHSCPYGISDAASLMSGFFGSSHIDYISPQLYTSGSEGANDYTTNGVAWSSYASSRAQIAPSIVTASYYASAQSYFSGLGITLHGYVQWAQ